LAELPPARAAAASRNVLLVESEKTIEMRL